MSRRFGTLLALAAGLLALLGQSSLSVAETSTPAPVLASSPVADDRLARLDAEIADLRARLAAAQERLAIDLTEFNTALAVLEGSSTPTPTATPEAIATPPTSTPDSQGTWREIKRLTKEIKRDLHDIEQSTERLAHRVKQRAQLTGVFLDDEDEQEDEEDDRNDRQTPTPTPTAASMLTAREEGLAVNTARLVFDSEADTREVKREDKDDHEGKSGEQARKQEKEREGTRRNRGEG